MPGSEGSCSGRNLFVLLCHWRVEYGYVLAMMAHVLQAQSQLLVLSGEILETFRLCDVCGGGKSPWLCHWATGLVSAALCGAAFLPRGVSCPAVLHTLHHNGQKPRAESSRASSSPLKLFSQVLRYSSESPVNKVSPSRWLSLHQDLCLICLRGLKTVHTHYSVTSAWAVTNASPFLSPLPVGEGKSGRRKRTRRAIWQ